MCQFLFGVFWCILEHCFNPFAADPIKALHFAIISLTHNF